jgi:dTDP-4-amino-4,6-dideoxygalactose transaminase
MHAQPSFKKFGYAPGDLFNSYRAFQQTLTLPLFGSLNSKEQKYIIDNLKKTMRIIQDLSPK